VVRRCRHKLTGRQFAAKSIRKRRSSSSRRGAQLHDIHREVALLAELEHRNVVTLYECYEAPNDVTLILELYVSIAGRVLFRHWKPPASTGRIWSWPTTTIINLTVAVILTLLTVALILWRG